MKVAILAGGQGTRLAEETRVKSKAMVPIGDQPILWHLLKYYEHFGFKHFVIASSPRRHDLGVLHRYGARRRSATARTCSCSHGGAQLTVELVDTGLTPRPVAGSSASRPISTARRSC
jgi:glucose-1-phosphate cytidylyltransferase